MSLAHCSCLPAGVDREADDLHAAAVELRLDLGHVAELGGADRGEVLRVGEEDHPGAVDPVVEVDRSLAGVRFEIGGNVAKLQSHLFVSKVRNLGRVARRTMLLQCQRHPRAHSPAAHSFQRRTARAELCARPLSRARGGACARAQGISLTPTTTQAKRTPQRDENACPGSSRASPSPLCSALAAHVIGSTAKPRRRREGAKVWAV